MSLAKTPCHAGRLHYNSAIMTNHLSNETRQLLDSLKTAVLLIDKNLKIVFINAACEEFFQISDQQINGNPIFDCFENTKLIEQCLARLQTESNSITIKEVAVKLLENKRKIVTCTINPLANLHQAPSLFASIELITESQFSILDSQNKDSKTTQPSSQKLIQGMAHEIKNPLGGIRGAAQLLSENLTSREDKEFINIIVHETDRLADLVDRMSGYIKDKKMLPLNIHRILEHVYKLLRSDSSDSVVIKRDYDPSLPQLNGSQASLTQAFINLGLNALQAIDDEGVITIRSRLVFASVIDYQQYRQVIRVDIQDNGQGIDENIYDTVFEPLVTSKSQGTGLGLSICNEIIAMHHGKIEYSSQPGKTIFSVYLPVIGHHS